MSTIGWERHACAALLLMGMAGIDAAGQATWRRTFGGLGTDDCNDVANTADGGFLFCGSTGSFGDGGDAYVIKVDGDGSPQWSVPLGGPGAQWGSSCLEDNDGVVVAGSNAAGRNGGYDMYLVRLDPTGELLWQKDIGTGDWDLCHDLKATDDGFVLVGESYGTGEPAGNAWIVRTNNVGDTLWTRSIGGDGHDIANGVFVDAGGHIMVVGTVDEGEETEDAFVAKLDSGGELLWMERFGGDSADVGQDITDANSGGYVFVGATRSFADVPQVLIVRIDMDGGIVWQREYGTLGETRMRRIVRRGDGYAMAGYNTVFNAGGKDMFLILVDGSGAWVLGKNYGGLDDEEATCVQALEDGGYILAGRSRNYGPGVEAIFAVRAGPDGETADDTVYPFFDPVGFYDVANRIQGNFIVSPNPNDGRFDLVGSAQVRYVDVYDVFGRYVQRIEPGQGGNRLHTDLANGVYSIAIIHHDGHLSHLRLAIER